MTDDSDLCPKCGMAYSIHKEDVVKSDFVDNLRNDATVCSEIWQADGLITTYVVWVHV